MQLLIARVGRLEALNRWTVLPEDRRGAELDYCKMFGLEWLASGGHRDPQQNRPSAEFTAQHPRYQSHTEIRSSRRQRTEEAGAICVEKSALKFHDRSEREGAALQAAKDTGC